MTTRQIVLAIPGKVLLAEKTDEASFAHELRIFQSELSDLELHNA